MRQTQLQKEQESLNHQLEKIILGRSLLNCKADLKGGFAHRTRTIQKPVDGNAWHKILSNQLANQRKVRNSLFSLRLSLTIISIFAVAKSAGTKKKIENVRWLGNKSRILLPSDRCYLLGQVVLFIFNSFDFD